VIIPLVILRLGYRLMHPPLPLPEDIPPLQQSAARATHWGLYGLLVVQPFVGWVATSAYRASIMVFGLFELPPIWPQDRPLSERLFWFTDGSVSPSPAWRPRISALRFIIISCARIASSCA
jgi:cytochrome b561